MKPRLLVEAPIDVLIECVQKTNTLYIIATQYRDVPRYKATVDTILGTLDPMLVMLDNGVFETGTPMETRDFIAIARETEPDYMFSPDLPGDTDFCAESAEDLAGGVRHARWGDRGAPKMLGVLQGVNYQDIRWISSIYDALHFDGYAFSYDLDCYQDKTDEFWPNSYTLFREDFQTNPLSRWRNSNNGRLLLLQKLQVPREKYVHFLGSYDSLEVNRYDKGINSLDTSCPVTLGLEGLSLSKMDVEGYLYKSPIRVDKVLEDKVSPSRRKVILENVEYLL